MFRQFGIITLFSLITLSGCGLRLNRWPQPAAPSGGVSIEQQGIVVPAEQLTFVIPASKMLDGRKLAPEAEMMIKDAVNKVRQRGGSVYVEYPQHIPTAARNQLFLSGAAVKNNATAKDYRIVVTKPLKPGEQHE